jgi:uncharacterized protein
MRIAIWTTLVGLVFVPCAGAASFDCNKASTFAEHAICEDSRLSAMDDELARLYKTALATASDSAKLKAEQTTWLATRDRCKDSNCIMKAYTDRIAALGKTSSAPPSGDFTGTYKTINGEALIQQDAGRIRFTLSATYKTNVGEVSGEVPLSRDVASYSDHDNDCELRFKFGGETLVVAQDGSCGMGLNVSGAGTYARVSAAPPKFDE